MKKIIFFLVMMLSFNVSVMAAHLDLVRINGVYSNQINMDTGDYVSYRQNKYIMDGKVVYCVEPGINIMTRDYNISSNLSDSGLNQNIINKISLIGHFGYDYPGHQTDNYFLAAQELIWETVGSNEAYFTTGQNDTGDRIYIDFEKNEIMSLVNHFSLKPSFDSTLVTGMYNDEVVLVDKNRVLSNYEISSTNNSVSIDGNKLIIKLSSLGTDTIKLTRKPYDDLSSVFYYSPISQDFMFLRANNVVTSTVSVNSYIPYSKVDISKKGLVLDSIDSSGNFIYKEGGISGVTFGLYASGDIYEADKLVYRSNQLIEELVTKNGHVSSRNLPNGKYYLKEHKTIDEFVLNDSIVNIELDNVKEEVYTYMVDLENERKNIFINLVKHGEVFDEIILGKGIYEDVPLSGVKFGLYSSNDIYNSKGDLLVKKDSLIKTLVTDSRGSISEKLNIPFGTYYLKELETVKGYKLDTNIYEFSVASNSNDDVKIMIGREPILNDIVKSRLVINKVDEDGNRLSNACFRLFDNLNNIIYEGCTDSNGVISIDDLGYGKYHFYEVSAPLGYLVSDKVYDINVIDDDSLIEVNVLNEKMPVTSDIYDVPKKFSTIGLGFGLLTLSLAIVYDKKHKNN